MVNVETSVVIQRPIDEVFGYLTDCTMNPTWLSMVLDAQWTSPEPHEVGATGVMTARFLGRRFEVPFEVVAYERPYRSAIRSGGGPFPLRGEYTFEPVEGGTRVRLSMEGTTQGFFKLADSLVGPMFKRGMRADLANLKTLLEARAGRAA